MTKVPVEEFQQLEANMPVNLSLARYIVEFLNKLVEVDRPAVDALMMQRVPCNPTLANHPSVQVLREINGYVVGPLGLLNGLAGAYDDGPFEGWGPIAARYDDSGKLIGFEIMENVRA